MKAKVKFVCQHCGYESARWLGKCSECNSWNSFVEEKTVTEKSQKYTFEAGKVSKVSAITDVEGKDADRYDTGINELNKVLGGGLVIGSLVLIGGEPGIGKSTLVLQMCNELSKKYGSVLYISGEESIAQIKMRATRLKAVSKDIFLVSETNIKVIEKHIYETKPKVVIIDSIQTIFNEDIPSAPGSVSQVRENATKLMYISKGSGVSIFLVGHVTKDGNIAGPRVLEHLVDTVLYFEGDKNHNFRILRSYKNRFGPANEIAVFEMAEGGLKEVENPSALFLAERTADASGSVIISAMEGTRPFLVEIQALVSPSYFGMPQRRASGLDYNRFTLLSAVLEKRGGFNLANQDIFVNVAGGVSVDEPAADLGVVVAIASSIRDIPTDAKTVCFGEVGLGGEIRAVSQVTERIKEAARLGFTKCIVPQSNMNGLVIKEKIQVQGARYIRDVLNTIF
ncbi:MAG: DNA repair protein RadA [Candidatus Firestonebacteria bacterium RIFOXYA2_FULL_40_8]|nr:MAG: DNA repair protein RadA [Candidatus Firestonebacteria bacterium RIFOXYA2_FULL_40_8]